MCQSLVEKQSRGKAVHVVRKSANAMIQEKLDGKTRDQIWEVRRKTGLEETGRQPGSQTNVEFVFSTSKRRGVKGFKQ